MFSNDEWNQLMERNYTSKDRIVQTMGKIDALTVGVVALQGAFIEHCEILDKLKVKNKQIRTVEDFKDVVVIQFSIKLLSL